jgi:multiple sugar transport system substrate-binding protein
MQNFISSLSRRTFLKLGAMTSAAGVAGTASASAAAAKTNPKGSGKISFWHHYTSDGERAGFAKVVDAFKVKSPGITLDITTVTNDDWMTKYIAATAAKSGPDTLMVTAARFKDMKKIGGLKDITTYVKNWPAKDGVSTTIGAFTDRGKSYGVPWFTFIDWMYYRKDLFDAAGITKPPATLEEFRQTAIALTNPSKNQYGFAMRGGSGGGGFIPKMIHAWNGPFINPRTLLRQVKFETVRDAVSFWVNLSVKDKAVVPTVTSDGFAQIMANFQTGKAAMVMHHTGSFVQVAGYFKYGTQVETAAMPAGPGASTGFTSPLAHGIFDSTKNPNAGFEWISYMGEAPAQVTFLKETGYFPTAASASEDAYVGATPQYKVALKAIGVYDTEYTFPGYTNWVSNTCLPEFQKALTGSQTAEKAARNIYDELGRVCTAASKALLSK